MKRANFTYALFFLLMVAFSGFGQVTSSGVPTRWLPATPVSCTDGVKSQALVYNWVLDKLFKCSGNVYVEIGPTGAGSGTVQSAALTMPGIFSVTGSPITTTGTFGVTLASQTQNLVFSSPNGSSGSPTFRSLVAADLPSLDAGKITTGVFSVARLGTGTPDGTKFLRDDGVFAVPSGGGGSSFLGSLGATDNTVPRSDGTGGLTFQSSSVTIDDNGNLFIPDTRSFVIGTVGVIASNSGTTLTTFGGATRNALYRSTTNHDFGIGGTTPIYRFTATDFRLISGGQIAWSDNVADATTTLDTGLIRSSAGILAVTNGIGGTGSLTVGDLAYNESTWNGSLAVPTRNAVRDYFESIPSLTQTLTNKTLTSPVIETKITLPRVTAFPGTPTAGDTVIVTDDSTAGACDSGAGSATSLCQYNGSAWVKLGDGTGGGGSLTSADIDTSAELRTILTDENGTGALLFDGATSPNFLTGLTIGSVAVPTISSTSTLTNKTLTNPIISTISNTGTLTLPTSTDTLVGRATTDTLTNKTLTSPIIGTKINLPRVTSLPGTPAAGDTVIVTDDSVAGACDSSAGSATTLCQYNGSAWVKLGDGTAAGLSSGDIDTSLELKTIVTDETGSGALVFGTSPTFTTGLTISGTTAGALQLTQGTTPTAVSANSIQLQAPTSVTTAYEMILPAASSTGLLLGTNSSNINTLSFLGTGTGVTTLLTTPSSANLRSALTDENGTGAALFDGATSPNFLTSLTVGGVAVPTISSSDTLTNKTLTSPTIGTKINLPRVTAFPGTPAAGDTVIVTDDSAAGACDSAAGSATTLCQYNGSAWVKLGDGGTAGSQAAIQFKDEGTNQGSSGATTIVDCVGAGITCSNSGTTVTMTVAGGGSSTFHRDMLMGSSLNPDTSGNVFLEPYANKATNDFFLQNVWVFNSPTADEKLYGSFELPAACTSGSAFKAVWTSTATSGTLQYSLAYRVVTADDTNSLDQTSAVETVTGSDTAPGAANRRMEVTITPTNSNFATAGTVQWIFTRVDTSDTVAAAITLHALRFTCTP